VLRPKGIQTVPPNDMLVVEMPGGGGFGNPLERDLETVARDVRYGLVSIDAAKRDYGVVVDEHGVVDEKATAILRKRRRARKR
jgi:N-methylhydantoinase B/oxoprolinase/acetone carboxylase alpha subunit